MKIPQSLHWRGSYGRLIQRTKNSRQWPELLSVFISGARLPGELLQTHDEFCQCSDLRIACTHAFWRHAGHFPTELTALGNMAIKVFSASAWPLYLAATSFHAGPTSFLSIAWHAPHLALPSAGISTAIAFPANIKHASDRLTTIVFIFIPKKIINKLFAQAPEVHTHNAPA